MCQLISLSPPPFPVSWNAISFLKLLPLKSGQLKADFGQTHSMLKSTNPKERPFPAERICHPLSHQMAQITGRCALQLSKEMVSSLSFTHVPKVPNPNWHGDSSMTAETEIFHLCLIQRLHPLFSDESLSEYHCAIFSLWKTMLSHCFLSPASICKIAFRRMA